MVDESKKKQNMFLHAYHFVRDHWGEMYVMYDLVKGFVSKEKPSDDAHEVVKLVHGGKRSIEDEIAYEAIEVDGLDPEERILMKDFRLWAKNRFADTTLGRRSYANFDNNFRQMVMHMRIPESVDPVKETTPNPNGQPTVKETKQRVPVDNTPAVDFLKRLTAAIQSGRNDTKGSVARKIEAGNLRGCQYLRDYNMPNPEASGLVKLADELLSKVPAAATTVGAVVSVVGRSTLAFIGEAGEAASAWIDDEHDKLEERNNREGRCAGFRRWYRSLR